MKKYITFLFAFLFMMSIQGAYAASAQQLNRSAKNTITIFYNKIPNGKTVLSQAKGVLVFPSVYKAGLGVGGEYGEGVLQIKGRTVDYYSTAAASVGFQLGAQKKSVLLLFMDQQALNKFRYSNGWKIGIDASVAVIAVGAGTSIDTAKLNKPIIAFVFDQKGLMYNLSLEGAKITRLHK